MATIKPVWTENVSVRASAALLAGASDTDPIDLDALGADRSDLQIDIDIGASTGITVEIFGSSDSGTTVDNVPLLTYTVAADDVRTIVLTGAWRQVKITNNDGSNEVTDVTIIHAWRKWDST